MLIIAAGSFRRRLDELVSGTDIGWKAIHLYNYMDAAKQNTGLFRGAVLRVALTEGPSSVASTFVTLLQVETSL